MTSLLTSSSPAAARTTRTLISSARTGLDTRPAETPQRPQAAAEPADGRARADRSAAGQARSTSCAHTGT
ncbi:hypothetical protein ABJI51_18000 [Amycolatopsis sp. NEAU-NG30]|uniref:Uncharacterized protein n=1 Tax=Amycolatopsis melonis TaxID=3156488 RepID=A0ABV0LFA6_9PSEU